MQVRPLMSSVDAATTSRPITAAVRPRHHRWFLAVALVVLGGVVGSVVAARSMASGDEETARRVFERQAAEVLSTLEQAIQHQDDLVVNTRALVLANPETTAAEFQTWASSARVMDRYPEIVGFGIAVIVPASELDAFIAEVSDPASAGPLQLTPPGDRPFYCLAKVGMTRETELAPIGMDLCASRGAASADQLIPISDDAVYEPVEVNGSELLLMSVPVFRNDLARVTAEARSSAFVGWVGTISTPQRMLDRALAGHRHMSVSMRYDVGSSEAEFSAGETAPGARTLTIDLRNGWTVTTSGGVTGGGLLTDGRALLVLMAGLVFSALLAALVIVLGTGRTRALRLVVQRTGELRHQALHDALTGLPNRALIIDRIEQLLARSRRSGTQGAALFVDLDDFKNINDSLGHEAGDRLLVAVAARLTTALRDVDTIGRMGGDEFVVLIDGGELAVAPELVAERLLDVMHHPFELAGATMPLVVNTSIGVAVGDRASGGELLRDADVALYEAKAAGKNRYEVFHPDMQSDIVHRIELEFDLRSAVESHEFRLAYQPIYNLDDLTLVGVEALLRWDHPTLGIIQPDEFIPILEQTGQIQEVGRWVLNEACDQMVTWHTKGYTADISVNVSAKQLDHDAIIDHIRDALETTGLDPSTLIIEVTETALMQNADATARRLQAIKDLGVRIAVDDFGTGYSSLAYLQRFPVDCLKIDRSFTSAITTSPEATALIGTLVQLGKDLGLQTLAEGVETTAEMDELRREHVNQAQGFLLSRPLDPDTLERQILAPAASRARTSHRS